MANLSDIIRNIPLFSGLSREELAKDLLDSFKLDKLANNVKQDEKEQDGKK